MCYLQDSHDFATRRQLVRSVIQDNGQSLIASILKACMFDVPRSMVHYSAEVFYELLALDRAVSHPLWGYFCFCTVGQKSSPHSAHITSSTTGNSFTVILQEICNNAIIKYPTSPQTRRYTTL